MNELTLTIIVPVYNEEESLRHFSDEMNQFLDQSPIDTTVLFVNDGSTDGSQALMEEISKENPSYQYITLENNVGLSGAIKAGIDASQSNLVGYIDADVQTSPMDFLKFLEFFPDYEMVNGIRAKRKDTIVKKLSSKIANSFRRTMINDGIQDTCCPLKIMKSENAKKIPFFDGMHRFIPALIQLQGGKVKQIDVNHFPRYAGTAKYNLWNRMRKPLIDTFAFRWMRNRYIRYELKK